MLKPGLLISAALALTACHPFEDLSAYPFPEVSEEDMVLDSAEDTAVPDTSQPDTLSPPEDLALDTEPVCPEGLTACSPGECVDLLNSPTACGSCDIDCMQADGILGASCEAGRCVFDCKDGFADCNEKPRDGCEASLYEPENCGRCGALCLPALNQRAECVEAQCVRQCEGLFADCNRLVEGCETQLLTAEACGGSCETLVSCGTGTCEGGTCLCFADGDPCPPGVGCSAAGRCEEETCGGRICSDFEACCVDPAGNVETCQNTLESPLHCGACNAPCKAGEICLQGQCGSP